MINHAFFFDYVRLHLFDGKMKPKQAEGLVAILDEWDQHHAAKDDRWLAYALGTAHHETARTMQPIREYGTTTYFADRYSPPPRGLRLKVAAELGNTESGDGPRFCGRGFVQLTGRRNYTNWATRLQIDLVANPDLAMGAAVAVKIMFGGMEAGSFTGKRFSDYFKGHVADWSNARRIINGRDKADNIASYALRYYAAISYT